MSPRHRVAWLLDTSLDDQSISPFLARSLFEQCHTLNHQPLAQPCSMALGFLVFGSGINMTRLQIGNAKDHQTVVKDIPGIHEIVLGALEVSSSYCFSSAVGSRVSFGKVCIQN